MKKYWTIRLVKSALLSLILVILAESMLIAKATACPMGGGEREYKMFDISQKARPEWGENWCAPTAVGNSFAWIAKEYGLDGLMKVGGTGQPLSAEEVIDFLGSIYMNTDPQNGTTADNIEKGKKDYIEAHGLKDKISVESVIFKNDSTAKKWIKDQYNKGQDIEVGLGYYEFIDNKWQRTRGHVVTYGEELPGLDVGGHVISLSSIEDPYNSDENTDFYISFTDPGRDDLTGEYGAISCDQYWLDDFSGHSWFNTQSTYKVVYDPDFFGIGDGAMLLNNYQGNNPFSVVIEMAWAESPVPEPSTMFLFGLGFLGLFGAGIKKRVWKG